MSRWPIKTCMAFLVGLLLSALALLPGAHAASEATSPDVAVARFYQWYIGQLMQNREPWVTGKEELKAYVKATLIRKIQRTMNSPDGMEADYFLAAQDYADDWAEHVNVTGLKQKGNSASVFVVLGVAKETTRRLVVELVREGALWKIARVQAPKSSG